ncbi:DUF4192 domain-containing protein [Wenjunlia tyrosinilytica]|uniref:DUF4192 domain-containing protein n=1 Tax=Wenjunlia tyrosinilytica TaxID=1544741 RepID=A0A917ZRP9_9ACTN|nr:DUF4192 domain-containing protein [Wenjunlia tyrosinilytica]GGO91416.1 hypothetical protein GCM10012280_39210 [Wenjunlia tyrosinilytica]
MTQNDTAPGIPFSRVPEEPGVTLRTPGELVDALPYLLGFHPDDSIVMVALHTSRSRFGARLRLDIPADPADWPDTARELARHLVLGSERRSGRPDGVLVFLCRDPAEGQEGQTVMEALRPLAQGLRTACGDLDVPVYEAVCIGGGRWWSYVCANPECCPATGTPVDRSGTSVMAAAAAYAGIQVRGSLSEMTARFAPLEGTRAEAQERALDEASADVVPRILDPGTVARVREETAVLLEAALDRFRRTPSSRVRAQTPCELDRADDAILGDAEAATIIVGLQDKVARDRAAEWMELPDAEPALRLWRALARRCVGPFHEHAAAPITLAGWVAWSSGDDGEARIAFQRALAVDPDYTFAQLLHEACGGGLDPEPLRRCLRDERRARPVPGGEA